MVTLRENLEAQEADLRNLLLWAASVSPILRDAVMRVQKRNNDALSLLLVSDPETKP